MKYRLLTVLTIVAAVLGAAAPARAERIKDIVDIQGRRSNPLLGYGLVIGLSGTGDGAVASMRALTNILRDQKLVFAPSDLSSKNIASVIVTADLGPYARRGNRIDVTVSAIGQTKSLRGGQLLPTELRGLDRQVYAIASGALIIGGFSASGGNSSVTKGHVTVGRIPGGAHVEKEELATVVENGEITLLLRNPDFTTADKIAKAIEGIYPESIRGVDAKAIRVTVPKTVDKTRIAGFIGRLGALEVVVDIAGVVIINERTGTIVIGDNVGISAIEISQGSLTIQVQEVESASQPNPFSSTGETAILNSTSIRAVDEGTRLHHMPRKVSVSELAEALNAMGLTPSDLISVFQGIRDAGALQGRLIVR